MSMSTCPQASRGSAATPGSGGRRQLPPPGPGAQHLRPAAHVAHDQPRHLACAAVAVAPCLGPPHDGKRPRGPPGPWRGRGMQEKNTTACHSHVLLLARRAWYESLRCSTCAKSQGARIPSARPTCGENLWTKLRDPMRGSARGELGPTPLLGRHLEAVVAVVLGSSCEDRSHPRRHLPPSNRVRLPKAERKGPTCRRCKKTECASHTAPGTTPAGSRASRPASPPTIFERMLPAPMAPQEGPRSSLLPRGKRFQAMSDCVEIPTL